NYHVWVEGWMRRPDLAQDRRYDGWQALDPTPQEKSEGIFCCGPAPVSAILNGDTNLKYDVPFVFAAVNADCISWLVKRDGSMVNIHSDTSRIGQNISTKSVGSTKRMNITDSYKHTEGV
ncbi:Protein-glutamine gamma-glutamyltransferase 2, partial [Xenoophorus captivus]